MLCWWRLDRSARASRDLPEVEQVVVNEETEEVYWPRACSDVRVPHTPHVRTSHRANPLRLHTR